MVSKCTIDTHTSSLKNKASSASAFYVETFKVSVCFSLDQNMICLLEMNPIIF